MSEKHKLGIGNLSGDVVLIRDETGCSIGIDCFIFEGFDRLPISPTTFDLLLEDIKKLHP